VGRDPAEIERSASVPMARFAGDPSWADALLEAGAHQITLGMGGPVFDTAPLRDWVAWRDEHNRSRA
jgi:hypothetical protein